MVVLTKGVELNRNNDFRFVQWFWVSQQSALMRLRGLVDYQRGSEIKGIESQTKLITDSIFWLHVLVGGPFKFKLPRFNPVFISNIAAGHLPCHFLMELATRLTLSAGLGKASWLGCSLTAFVLLPADHELMNFFFLDVTFLSFLSIQGQPHTRFLCYQLR